MANGYPLAILFERLGIDTLHTQRQVDDAQLATLEQLRSSRLIRAFEAHCRAFVSDTHIPGMVAPAVEARTRRRPSAT